MRYRKKKIFFRLKNVFKTNKCFDDFVENFDSIIEMFDFDETVI